MLDVDGQKEWFNVKNTHAVKSVTVKQNFRPGVKPDNYSSNNGLYILYFFELSGLSSTGLFVFFPHPIYYLRPFFSLYLLVVTQIRGHIAGSSPPSPIRSVPCISIAIIF